MVSCRERRACRSLLNGIALGIFCSIETKGHSAEIKLWMTLFFFFLRKNRSCIKYEPVMFEAYSAPIATGENTLLLK